MKDKIYTVIMLLVIVGFVMLGIYYINDAEVVETVKPDTSEMVTEKVYDACEYNLEQEKTKNYELQKELDDAKTILDTSICFDKRL